MQYKFAAHRFTPPVTATPDKLRNAFESAVREIHRADVAAGRKEKYRVPIVPRATILRTSTEVAEKRALCDAARALAQLWKV